MTIGKDLLKEAKNQALKALMKSNSQANAQSVRCDLVPWYDTYFFNWATATPGPGWDIIVPTSQTIKFFSDSAPFQYLDGAVPVTIPRTKKWSNHELSDSIMNSQSAYGIIAFYYQFHPYPGAAFENWFINRVNPMFKAQVGKRDTKRWDQKLGYLNNYRPVDYSAQAALGNVRIGTVMSSGTFISTNHFSLPTSILEEPWIIEPKDQCLLELEIENLEAGTRQFYDSLPPYELAKYFLNPSYADTERVQGRIYPLAISLGLIGVWCTVS